MSGIQMRANQKGSMRMRANSISILQTIANQKGFSSMHVLCMRANPKAFIQVSIQDK